MIKVGCLHPLSPDIESFIESVNEFRLDTIDFLRRAFSSTDPTYLRHIKMLCLKHGLPVGYLGVSGGFVGPDDEVRARVDTAKETVDVALFMGAPLVRVFGGSYRPGTEDLEPLWPNMIASHQEIADYALEKGVIVALQNHDNNNLAATSEDVLRILREVDRPNFSFIMDTGQWRGSIGASPKGEPDPDADIYAYMEETVSHAVCVRTKFYRIDSGVEEWLDYDRIIQILKEADYNGNLSIAYEGQGDPLVDIGKAANYLRRLLAENGM